MPTIKKPVKQEKNTVVKDKTAVKKPILRKQEVLQKPTYKNLRMAVDIDERETPSRNSNIPTRKDSLDYASGFKKGLNRKKDAMENTVSRAGRWEGQNTPKEYIGGSKSIIKTKSSSSMKKAKSGTSLGMKSVKAGFDNNPGVTRADIITAAKKKAKSGAALKKQAATAIAMKKAGKSPKKAMMGKTMMKSGGKMKTCKGGC